MYTILYNLRNSIITAIGEAMRNATAVQLYAFSSS